MGRSTLQLLNKLCAVVSVLRLVRDSVEFCLFRVYLVLCFQALETQVQLFETSDIEGGGGVGVVHSFLL